MADERVDLRRLPKHATLSVHNWLFMIGLDNPVLEEPIRLIRSGVPYEQAAAELKTWFLERLTVDPGVGAPFSDLGYNLLSMIFDLIDWRAIIGVIRRWED